MTAFDRAWLLMKAEQEFIVTENPEEIARKRAWLYQMDYPTDPDELEEFLEEYGFYGTTMGQANNKRIYGKKRNPIYDTAVEFGMEEGVKEFETDYDNATFDEGRTLLNLPQIADTARMNARQRHRNIINERLKDEEGKRKEGWYEEWSDYWKQHEGDDGVLMYDDDLIDEIIRVINHEVGHTTQPQEEEEWVKQYDKWNAPYRVKGLDGIWRRILMQETLASIFEEPHGDWREKVAEYSALNLNDHHPYMREVSDSMNRYFIDNPEKYRDFETVEADKEKMKEFWRKWDEEHGDEE